ncbi:MAG TPA: radical SAM protein [Phycisphaerae bacterium]|nr:radical SAM protein [Phycisphaerae bacterium]
MDAARDRKPCRESPAAWEYAGLMVTYWCNARCAFCYVYSGPDRGGSLEIADAVALWRGLDERAASAGKTMRIHLAGGEPFGDWPRLVGIIRAARDAGLTRLEKVETNAFWATDDDLTRARLELLDALGMEKLVVSSDVYHQEYVPFENVRRCVETARRVLGRGRVRVRWWDFYNDPTSLRGASESEKAAAYQAALRRHGERLTGRAAQRLAALLPRRPAAHFAGESCAAEVLQGRHVHIDPYGNVFPGTCSGIILGNALRPAGTGGPPTEASAARPGVAAVWDALARDWPQHPVVSAVVAGGSHELMRRASALGYRELPGGYADKCHLCAHVRQFLVQRGHWPQHLGPPECYAMPSDQAAPASVPLPVL